MHHKKLTCIYRHNSLLSLKTNIYASKEKDKIVEEVKPEEKDIIIDKMPEYETLKSAAPTTKPNPAAEKTTSNLADTQSDETVQVASPPLKRPAGGQHEDAGCL